MDVATGSYSDGKLDDEKVFAGMELFISTGEASYKPTLNPNETSIVPAWPEVYGLAVYGAATHATELGADAATAKKMLTDYANEFAYEASKGFGVVMSQDDFVWGSTRAYSFFMLTISRANRSITKLQRRWWTTCLARIRSICLS